MIMKQAKLEELRDTEEKYLRDLQKINSFLTVNMIQSRTDPAFPTPMPDTLQEMEYIFIGNFPAVIDFHQKVFTSELIHGLKNTEQTKNLLEKRKYDMKDLYGKYCSNWTKTEHILKRFKSYFKAMERYPC